MVRQCATRAPCCWTRRRRLFLHAGRCQPVVCQLPARPVMTWQCAMRSRADGHRRMRSLDAAETAGKPPSETVPFQRACTSMARDGADMRVVRLVMAKRQRGHKWLGCAAPLTGRNRGVIDGGNQVRTVGVMMVARPCMARVSCRDGWSFRRCAMVAGVVA